MFVRNVHGTYSMPNVSFTGKKCSVKGCSEPGCDRGHVYKCHADGELISRKIYIIPMCTEHNRSKTDEALEVTESTVFIEINAR